ncbi:MAG: hypothetical protein PVF17_13895 [Ignavibacteria bacterium]|jgi:hypothetical protein
MRNDTKKEILRHSIAVLVYRISKILRDVPEDYETIKNNVRTPIEILKHIVGLIDWAYEKTAGVREGNEYKTDNWEDVVTLFYDSIKKFDDYLTTDKEINCTVEKLLQGPVTDALTHVGQLAMLRRYAGAPVKGESYFEADIKIGHVGSEQSLPAKKFD